MRRSARVPKLWARYPENGPNDCCDWNSGYGPKQGMIGIPARTAVPGCCQAGGIPPGTAARTVARTSYVLQPAHQLYQSTSGRVAPWHQRHCTSSSRCSQRRFYARLASDVRRMHWGVDGNGGLMVGVGACTLPMTITSDKAMEWW